MAKKRIKKTIKKVSTKKSNLIDFHSSTFLIFLIFVLVVSILLVFKILV